MDQHKNAMRFSSRSHKDFVNFYGIGITTKLASHCVGDQQLRPPSSISSISQDHYEWLVTTDAIRHGNARTGPSASAREPAERGMGKGDPAKQGDHAGILFEWCPEAIFTIGSGTPEPRCTRYIQKTGAVNAPPIRPGEQSHRSSLFPQPDRDWIPHRFTSPWSLALTECLEAPIAK